MNIEPKLGVNLENLYPDFLNFYYMENLIFIVCTDWINSTMDIYEFSKLIEKLHRFFDKNKDMNDYILFQSDISKHEFTFTTKFEVFKIELPEEQLKLKDLLLSSDQHNFELTKQLCQGLGIDFIKFAKYKVLNALWGNPANATQYISHLQSKQHLKNYLDAR